MPKTSPVAAVRRFKTTASLPHELYLQLVTYCAEHRIDQQDLIAEALISYLDAKKQPQGSRKVA